MKVRHLFALISLFLLVGCSSAAASMRSLTPTAPALPSRTIKPAQTFTPLPSPASPDPTATALLSSTPTSAADTAASTPVTPEGEPTALPCTEELCFYANNFIFARPIAPPGRDTIDQSYRFGTTQNGTRDPHHGDEFLNMLGTPVLAAADGEVVFAGDDRRQFQGPYSYFYGNVIVIQHDPPPGLPDLEGPLFTLYGHLSEISVEVGEKIHQGQVIGKVGMTGVATGSHLHFEVRVGENLYKHSSNPEMWLQPLLDAEGQPMGAIAGRILDKWGSELKVDNIVLERIAPAGGEFLEPVYVRTYEYIGLRGQPPFHETFAAGDLPAGTWRVSFAQYGYQQFDVEVLPGQLTMITFTVGE